MSESQPRTYPNGVPSWVDITTPDIDATSAFYGGLFGWSVDVVTPPGAPTYAMATIDGLDVAGVAGGEGPATWSTYISVDDADATVERAVAAGGAVVTPPFGGGEGGRAAVLTDPSGAEIRLWEPQNRPGAQKVNEAGSWVFNDLRSDAEDALAFYAAVWGWETTDLGGSSMVRRPGYGAHLAATVYPDILSMQEDVGAPPGFEDVVAWWSPADADRPPYWHVMFAVDDRDAAAEKAASLGATVEGSVDSEWTRDVTIVDPQGARLTLSQFVPPT